MATNEQSQSLGSYLDEFLSAIRVFGFLEKPVFHELARHLQTRRLIAGDTLSLDSDNSFYIVIDGTCQVYVPGSDANADLTDDDKSPMGKFQLLNEVTNGGTLSSLFTILSLFTEKIRLRYEHQDTTSPPSRQPTPAHGHPPPPLNRDVSHLSLDGRSRAGSLSRARTYRQTPPPPEEPLAFDSPSSSPSTSFPQVPSRDEPRSMPHSRRRESHHFSMPSSPPPQPSKSTQEPIIARAKVDTTLAVIPAEAFQRVTKKFPNASAHIIQGIFSRFFPPKG